MRLLIITQKVDRTDPVLGFFHAWIETFAEQCTGVEVVCLEEGGHTLPYNVSVHSLGKEKGRSRFKYFFRFYYLIFTLRHRYDVVLVHMNPEYVVLGGALWHLWKKKVSLWYAHGAVSRTLRLAEYFSDYIFTSTKEGFRVPSTKVHVLHQGIDTALFTVRHTYTDDIFTAVVVGRLSPVKRIERAIEAVQLLAEKGVPVALHIVGSPITGRDQHYEKELKRKVAHASMSHLVHFLGAKRHDELPDILSTAHVMVHVSETGSLDKTVLEAFACGVPVVSSSDVVRSLLPKETHDLLCAPPDAEDLVHHIEKLIALPITDREALGLYLRGIVERDHSLKHLVETMINELRIVSK